MLFVILTMLISSPTPTIISTKRSHVWLGKGKKARAKRQKFGRDALIKTTGGQGAKAGLSHDIVISEGGSRGWLAPPARARTGPRAAPSTISSMCARLLHPSTTRGPGPGFCLPPTPSHRLTRTKLVVRSLQSTSRLRTFHLLSCHHHCRTPSKIISLRATGLWWRLLMAHASFTAALTRHAVALTSSAIGTNLLHHTSWVCWYIFRHGRSGRGTERLT